MMTAIDNLRLLALDYSNKYGDHPQVSLLSAAAQELTELHAFKAACEKQKAAAYWDGKITYAQPWEMLDNTRSSSTKGCTIPLYRLPDPRAANEIAKLHAENETLRSDVAKWVTDYQAQKMRSDRLEWERGNIDEGLRRLSESEIKLRAENEALRAKLELAEACLAGDAALIAGLKGENESLRKDAERYRWLVNNDSEIGICHLGDEYSDAPYLHDATEKIDAAMKGQ